MSRKGPDPTCLSASLESEMIQLISNHPLHNDLTMSTVILIKLVTVEPQRPITYMPMYLDIQLHEFDTTRGHSFPLIFYRSCKTARDPLSGDAP
jgi:hypothetical protein